MLYLGFKETKKIFQDKQQHNDGKDEDDEDENKDLCLFCIVQ